MTTAQAQKLSAADLLVRVVEEAFRRSTWNGTNFLTSIKDVDHVEAGWKPTGGKHRIADQVAHCAYWKDTVRRRITGDRKRTFPLAGSDWFELPEPLTEQSWAELLELARDRHAALVTAVRDLDLEGETGHRIAGQVYGVAMHDVYHTGQIHQIRAQFRRSQN